MFRLTRTQTQPIGLDIGTDSIKMLQTEVVGGELTVTAAIKHPFPDDARRDMPTRMAVAVEKIREILGRGVFSGRNVVAALPREMVHIKNLRMPIIPATELEQAVLFEVRNLFGFDAEQARVCHLPAGEVRQGTDVRQEVVVIAARTEEIDNYVEQLNFAGCVVDSLDIEPCALYRSVERFIRRKEDEHEVYVIVDIGWQGSRVLIGRGRDISFYKDIQIGGRHLIEAVSRKLGISNDEARALRQRLIEATEPADPTARRDPVRQAVFDGSRSTLEELGREISLCLRYYTVTFRGHRPTKLRVVGGEATDPNVIAILSSALSIPVEPGRALHNLNVSRMKPVDRRGTGSEWTTALGLSLKLTRQHFAGRDGRPRDPGKPVPAASAETTVVPARADARGVALPGNVENAARQSADSREVSHA